jgi:hypothetical protein
MRVGLARIGALLDTPGELGFEGPEAGVELPSTLYTPNTIGESLFVDPAGYDDDDSLSSVDDELDVAFEIGPEIERAAAAMGGEAGHRIRRSTLVLGTDTLGYYVPFHAVGTQWGAHVRTSGLLYLAMGPLAHLDLPLERRLTLAFNAILSHELFHFATETAIAQTELLLGEPWFIKAKLARRGMQPPYVVEEEALANAYMLARFRSARPEMRVRGKQEALKKFTRNQPVGYRDGVDIKAADWPARLESLTATFGAHGTASASRTDLWDGAGGQDWGTLYPILPRVPWRHCAIHLVNDLERFNLPSGFIQHFSRLPNIQESEKFQSMLAGLPNELQRAWTQQKSRLGQAITAGADFKPWRPAGKDVYSVRVNKSFRAHLKYEREQQLWVALEIGSHAAMGHG